MSNRLRGHVVVMWRRGALGTRIADALDSLHDVVLIDIDAESDRDSRAPPTASAWCLQGDATQLATLIGAGIETRRNCWR